MTTNVEPAVECPGAKALRGRHHLRNRTFKLHDIELEIEHCGNCGMVRMFRSGQIIAYGNDGIDRTPK